MEFIFKASFSPYTFAVVCIILHYECNDVNYVVVSLIVMCDMAFYVHCILRLLQAKLSRLR